MQQQSLASTSPPELTRDLAHIWGCDTTLLPGERIFGMRLIFSSPDRSRENYAGIRRNVLCRYLSRSRLSVYVPGLCTDSFRSHTLTSCRDMSNNATSQNATRSHLAGVLTWLGRKQRRLRIASVFSRSFPCTYSLTGVSHLPTCLLGQTDTETLVRDDLVGMANHEEGSIRVNHRRVKNDFLN